MLRFFSSDKSHAELDRIVQKAKEDVSFVSSVAGDCESGFEICEQKVQAFLRVYQRVREILCEEELCRGRALSERRTKVQRFQQVGKHVLLALRDLDGPEDVGMLQTRDARVVERRSFIEARRGNQARDSALMVDGKSNDRNKTMSTVNSDDHGDDDWVSSSGDDDDGTMRASDDEGDEDLVKDEEDSDIDYDDDDDGEDEEGEEVDEDEDYTTMKKSSKENNDYTMLIVLANMDIDDSNVDDDYENDDHDAVKKGEEKKQNDTEAIFAGFRGVEAKLKREKIRAHCLRLASNYSISSSSSSSGRNRDDVREYIALFRDRFGGCAARADAVTAAMGSVPICWLLNDFLSGSTTTTTTTTTKQDNNNNNNNKKKTIATTKTATTTAEILVQSSDGREVSFSTASSENVHGGGGLKIRKLTLKACLDRNAVCFSGLDYAKTSIFNVNDGNGESLLIALGIKNAYGACDVVVTAKSAFDDDDDEIIDDFENEKKVLAVLNPLTATSFSLTPVLAQESETYREMIANEGSSLLQNRNSFASYEPDVLKNAFFLLNDGVKKLRACEDISRMFQVTLAGTKKSATTTTATTATTATTTTTTTSLTKYSEDDHCNDDFALPSSQRTTSTTAGYYEEEKENFDDYDANALVIGDEIFFSNAFAYLTKRITPRDAFASLPIVERFEDWYGLEENVNGDIAQPSTTTIAGKKILASIARSKKRKVKNDHDFNDEEENEVLLRQALDERFDSEFFSKIRDPELGFAAGGDFDIKTYNDPRSPEKFTRVRDHSTAFDLPKSPPSTIKRKKRQATAGGTSFLSPSRPTTGGKNKASGGGGKNQNGVNFEDEDDVTFSPRKKFKSPGRKKGLSTTNEQGEKAEKKIELWTVGPEPDCFNAAKSTYEQFINSKCTKPNEERDPDLGAFSRNIVKRLAVSLSKRRCLVDQANDLKAWNEILRETKENLCMDRKELKAKFCGETNKGLKRREYVIQIHLRLTLHAMRTIEGDELPFIANTAKNNVKANNNTNSASNKKLRQKLHSIQEDLTSAKKTAKAVEKLIKDITFLLEPVGLEGTRNFLEADIEPHYGKYCSECVGKIAFELGVSTKSFSRYEPGKKDGGNILTKANTKSTLAPFSPPAAKRKKTDALAAAGAQQQVLRRSPRKLGGAQKKTNTSLALVSTSSMTGASSAFQQPGKTKNMQNWHHFSRSNQPRVEQQKRLSPSELAKLKKLQEQQQQIHQKSLQQQHNPSRLQNNNVNNGLRGNGISNMYDLNTAPRNRFQNNNNPNGIGVGNGVVGMSSDGIKPRQLTHAFSKQPLQTPRPAARAGGVNTGVGSRDRFAITSTPLRFGNNMMMQASAADGIGTPNRIPDTNERVVVVVESTPMGTIKRSSGGKSSAGRRQTSAISIGNNEHQIIIEQTPINDNNNNRGQKFTSVSNNVHNVHNNNNNNGMQQRRESLEVVAETPPSHKHRAQQQQQQQQQQLGGRSARLIRAALDSSTKNV